LYQYKAKRLAGKNVCAEWDICTLCKLAELSVEWDIVQVGGWFVCRLHEFDEQVRWVREGMAHVLPVPMLSLFTGYELEMMV